VSSRCKKKQHDDTDDTVSSKAQAKQFNQCHHVVKEKQNGITDRTVTSAHRANEELARYQNKTVKSVQSRCKKNNTMALMKQISHFVSTR
jgi:prephenate dehydratase